VLCSTWTSACKTRLCVFASSYLGYEDRSASAWACGKASRLFSASPTKARYERGRARHYSLPDLDLDQPRANDADPDECTPDNAPRPVRRETKQEHGTKGSQNKAADFLYHDHTPWADARSRQAWIGCVDGKISLRSCTMGG
jgi:hypothetical protein